MRILFLGFFPLGFCGGGVSSERNTISATYNGACMVLRKLDEDAVFEPSHRREIASLKDFLRLIDIHPRHSQNLMRKVIFINAVGSRRGEPVAITSGRIHA
jgi:hypothetical protein